MQIDQTTKFRRITVPVERARLAMTVPVEEEVAYRLAGEELGLTVNIYRSRYPNHSEIPGAGYIAMAAIDIAYRAEKVRQRLETRDWADRLQSLNQEAERTLARIVDL
ncbi:MAG: cell division protein ZapA [Porphyromonadaceae bacterium]|nr:cell division protein ZapA [Porphyromonadaceae bacterium]